ncbi:MAG TPA: 3-dehydroquinate synthase [Chthoniobacterales bacterium]
MTKIPVNAGNNSYSAMVGSGSLDSAGSLISDQFGGGRCAIVADTNSGRLFGERLQQSLTTAQIEPITITIPAGEQFKTLLQAGLICDQMFASGLDRHSLVIGLGGGVVGDISGFVAAVFQRGVPHVQIPTTLLAMVDSSIGGKTGVNAAAGKNLIGAVHHPALIIHDVELLRSLPEREFKQGFAEIIKHAIIADAEMFGQLAAAQLSALRTKEATSEKLTTLICRNIEIKARIVSKDELDRTGDRALLNFGHTVGHGIERAADYIRMLHGEAISLGMVAAADISMKRAGLPQDQRDAIADVLQRFGLPTRLPDDIRRNEVLDALKHDKKFERGQIRFVVTPEIGSAYLSSEVTLEDIREAVAML